ncbi:hypothetical protein [Streptomyces alkaliterrae]|uniref:Uncharacterized protein n=1 Tax=Streptomyces alkaliterrae TaxID=2213162 RepID=A0A5P0YRR9_9ACTN|nr:hypothetical protein [Streptomyces alkaliterrae]MBB1260150.1 hypothetical protein [Streptomyces alkaliterrae]MQS03021.1 hypothetical protein [Streptomyces alkaliterrae]
MTTPRTVYDGELRVHYCQFDVVSGTEDHVDFGGRTGQRNGLCIATTPGALFLVTGLHTGTVGLTVELHDTSPPIEDHWEEVVEVSFRPVSSRLAVVPWGDGALCETRLDVRDHRVRYCALGMDEARERESEILEGDLTVDRYLLQFWPAPPAPDGVIRQTSASAAYWHGLTAGN